MEGGRHGAKVNEGLPSRARQSHVKLAVSVDVAVMSQEPDGQGSEAEIAEHCEWVNAWTPERRKAVAAAPAAAPVGPAKVIPLKKREPASCEGVVDPAASHVDLSPADQLACDLAEIAQARDALLANAPPGTDAPKSPGSRIVWLPFALRRTADSVPIVLGSVLGLLMLIVFSVAAVFAKLAR
jgi:hypothetical protein